jgi:hypothetical protein
MFVMGNRNSHRQSAISIFISAFMVITVAQTTSYAQMTKLTGPVTFGSPDQPFGVRRPVTAADRALIQSYRAERKPLLFSTKFDSQAELQADWDPQTDDNASLKSCRRPANLEPSSVGLRFRTSVATDCRAHWSTASTSSKAKYSYGFFEASMKIADIKGMNNAFWLTTDDHFEIDVTEAQYPNYSHITLHRWPANKDEKHASVGFGAKFDKNLAYDFHDYGVLWTPTDLIFEVDGEPVAALTLDGSLKGPATVRFSTALADWASGPVPEHPEGHGAVVKSLRIYEK